MHDGLRRLRLALGWVILVAWVAGFVVPIFVPTWEPPREVGALLTFICGVLFGPQIVRRRNGNGNGAKADE